MNKPRKTTPLIPRKALFGNPDKTMARVSPDGTRISYLAPVQGVLNIWVGPVDDLEAAQPVTHDTQRGIRDYGWAYTSEHIAYAQDKEGDENWHIYSVALATGKIRDLTPEEGVQARIQEVSHKFTDEIILALNDRDPELHDLYRVNLDSGERTLVQHNEGFAGFITDDDYRVRFAEKFESDGGLQLFRQAGDTGWEPFLKVEAEDVLTTSHVGFDRTGRVRYSLDSRGRNTSALISMDLETGKEAIIAHGERADAVQVMIHPTEKTIQAVAFNYDRKEWEVLDEPIAQDLTYLGTVDDGDLEVVSRTLDDQRWVVAYLKDDGPTHYHLYDRDNKKSRFLFSDRQELEGVALANMHPTVIESRDGLKLLSYCTLPVGSAEPGGSRPDHPLPMVLLVHGGPWERDRWGYNPLHQMLANRGYAVLSVNFRGSTGFGKKFINAGNREWGAKMHNDLIDAVQWAIDQGIADSERVAIMGGSYGGYATLVGLTFTPEIFACGVDLVGPSNLVTLIDSVPPYWKPMVEMWANRVGDQRTEEGKAFLMERSPVSYVDRITKPLLIVHGVNDPRVKQSESDQIVGAMQEKNIPVTYVLYPDEGHGFARPENWLSFVAVTEAFLARHLGGRSEASGDDFTGSSITVSTGHDQLPGLADAL
ncbi:MAG: S9 family peptidase [Acidobacteriota bacterium]